MKHFIKVILLILLFVHHFYAQPIIRVYILAGQSNMSGTNNPLVSELPASLLVSVPDVFIKVNGDVNYNWQVLRPGLGATLNNFGPELTFGNDAFNKFGGDKTAIIKFSYGCTTLNDDWRPPSSGGTLGWLYTNFINDINASLDSLKRNYSIEIMGVCWMQGEYDALDITKANNYQTNLINFIGDIRTELNLPQLPFVIGMIDHSESWTYNNIVRQGEINVAKSINDIGIFDTHGLGTDGRHYNTQGQLELGHFFFNYLGDSYATCQFCIDGTIQVFPNPSAGSFKIISSGIPTDYVYIITDSKGSMVQSGQLYIGCEIDISTLSPDIYFISLITNSGTTIKKIIKL